MVSLFMTDKKYVPFCAEIQWYERVEVTLWKAKLGRGMLVLNELSEPWEICIEKYKLERDEKPNVIAKTAETCKI